MPPSPAKWLFRPSAMISRRVKLAGAVCSVSLLFLASGCLSRSLTGLTIEPTAGLTCVVPGVSAQFKVYGIYTETNHATTTQDLSSQVNWSATIPLVARVDSSGLVTGQGLGTTSILAQTKGQFGVLTATSDVQVKNTCGTASVSPVRGLTSVQLIPADPARPFPSQDLAIGSFNAPPFTADLTDHIVWRPDLIAPRSETKAISGVGLANVSVYKAGSGTGTVTATSPLNCDPNAAELSCRAQVSKGTTLTLWAAPNAGSVFDGWSSKCAAAADGNPRECTLSVDSDTNVAAIFDPK